MKPQKLVRSQAQEKRLALRTGGRRQPQSGASVWAKNDVKDERYLYEAKRTDNVKSISIKISDVDALEAHAADESLEPVMYIEIAGRFFMLCPEWVWENR